MSGTSYKPPRSLTRRRVLRAALCASTAFALSACADSKFDLGDFGKFGSTAPTPPPGTEIGQGQVRVGLILPMSGQGGGGVGTSLKNAAELALSDFKNPNIQLLVKDDGGTPQGAQAGAQAAMDEGAEIILGPLFAQSVRAVAQITRPRNIPVIAFSTDASVASQGVYLLSFLPESDVRRIVEYAASRGKRSFAALIPDNAYGAVVQAAFQQEVPSRGGRVVVLEKYPLDPSRLAEPVHAVAQAATQVDSIFIPDNADSVVQLVQALSADHVNLKRLQLLGTGVWDDPHIFATPALQGAQRFSEAVLTNSSGFSGKDGLFRFRPDGTNERGLAVLRVGPTGPQVVAPAPRAFGPAA